jgi:dipeptidyl-peptidase-4
VSLPKHEIVRTLVKNEKLRAAVAALQRGPQELVKVQADSQAFNAWVMKPVDFDPSHRYPVLFYVYGGPGSQTVLDSWGGSNYLWYVMLTQRGYAVASVDNRGTGMRGRDWRKVIYGRLGVVETQDQAAAARAIGQWPWVDQDRMGIWGWSYGGFMTLNALFRAPDVYRAGVAVAPVTHWKYYDNIYTERYNALPQTNQAGYDAGSPLSYADSLRGDLLVVHGSGDDNVHFQNTEALLNALVKANKQFQFMEYPNRTHSIAGGNTREHLYTLMTRYLDEHLRNPHNVALTP